MVGKEGDGIHEGVWVRAGEGDDEDGQRASSGGGGGPGGQIEGGERWEGDGGGA